ncbi:glycosyltransferase family 4 protein [Salinimicrobium sp. CDJ15-81-2]|nr:glycosyltransferase family 4 protein [Salinimicrobium nanhaiense]
MIDMEKRTEIRILKIWSTFQTELKYHDHYLSEILIQKGVISTFLSSNKVDPEFKPFLKKKIKAGEDNYAGMKIIRLKSAEIGNKPFLLEVHKLYKELTTNKHDIVHINGIGNPITFYTLATLFLFNRNLPVIINDHSNPNLKNKTFLGNIYYKFNIFLFKILGRNVRQIITPNLASFEFVKNHYVLRPKRMSIIPLGYDSDIFNQKQKISNSKKFLIGFAGKIVPGKRLETLVDALANLNDNSIYCEIVGLNDKPDAYQNHIVNYAKESGANITFSPLIREPERLASFYNSLDVAIFPGSISITTVEASGCGTPIILYNSIPGLEDRVEENRGVLFSSQKDLEQNILRYKDLKNAGLLNNEEIARNTIKYSWKNISQQYLDLYKKCLEQK